MPTKRTLRKFGRDLVVAVVVAAGAFVTDNVGMLDLNPETTAIIVAGAMLVVRTARGYLGKEPAE